MQSGIIARQTAGGDDDDGSYVFCIPGLGKVAAAVLAGRREMRALLKRRMHQEVCVAARLGGFALIAVNGLWMDLMD